MAHIALIVGHTSQAPGAVSIVDVSEYEYNSIVAKFLEEKLTAMGYRVSRVERGLPNQLSALPAKVNATSADFAVELHFNSFTDPSANGCETLHWHTSANSTRLAQHVQKAVIRAFGLRDRGLRAVKTGQRGDTLLKGTRMPCILTEPFFGSSPTDWSTMKRAHEELADAYARGLDAYADEMGIKPAKPSVSSTARAPHVQAVIDAWGTADNTDAQRQAREIVERDWPALADAIRHLKTL